MSAHTEAEYENLASRLTRRTAQRNTAEVRIAHLEAALRTALAYLDCEFPMVDSAVARYGKSTPP